MNSYNNSSGIIAKMKFGKFEQHNTFKKFIWYNKYNESISNNSDMMTRTLLANFYNIKIQ